MESVTHSRLLKFIVPQSEIFNKHKTKMADKVNFIYENHKNLQTEVPSSQQLREGPIDVASEENTAEIEQPNLTAENVFNMTQVTDDKAEFSNDASVFVPVLTVTKEEAAYTTSKGDTKLQKVSIKEKLSEVNTGSKKKMEVVVNPFYSEVVSVVIPGPHELRAVTLDRGVSGEPTAKESSNDDGDHKSEEKKAKTKIPVLKFKQMVDKVKQEKKEDRKKEKTENRQEATPSPHRNPRRSSIPRLKNSRRDSASAEKDGAKQKPEVIDKEPNILVDDTIYRNKIPGEKNGTKHKPETIVKEPNVLAGETIDRDKIPREKNGAIPKPEVIVKEPNILVDDTIYRNKIPGEKNGTKHKPETIVKEPNVLAGETIHRDNIPREKNGKKPKPEVIVKEPNIEVDDTIYRNKIPGEKNGTKQKPETIVKEPNVLAGETIHRDKIPREKNGKKPKPEVIVKEPNIEVDDTIYRNKIPGEKNGTKQKPETIVKEPNVLAGEAIHRDKIPREKNGTKPKPEVIVKEPNIEVDEKIHIHIPPEEEFNKLFEDIINNETQETIIISPIEDPEKLENKFEEIVHNYEENKIQPINVEKIKYSKIPLLKRTSENELNVPKHLLGPTPIGDNSDLKSSKKEFLQRNNEDTKLKSDSDKNTEKSEEIVESKRKGSIIAEITIPASIRLAPKLADEHYNINLPFKQQEQEKQTNKQIIISETKIPLRKRLSEQDIHDSTRNTSTKVSILLSDCRVKNTIENKGRHLQNTQIKSENEIDEQVENKDIVITKEPLSLQECELSVEPKNRYLDKDRQNMVHKVNQEIENISYKTPLLRQKSDRNIQKLQDNTRSTLKKSISVDERNLKSDFPTKETAKNVKDKSQKEIEDMIVKPNELKDSEQEINKIIPNAPKTKLLKELKDINEQDEKKLPQEITELYKINKNKVPFLKRGSDDNIQNAESITKPELKKSLSVGDNRRKIDDTNTVIEHKIKSIAIKPLVDVDVDQFTKKTENERVSLINEITLPTNIRNLPKEIEGKNTNINKKIRYSNKERVSKTDNENKESKIPFTDRGVHHIQVPREIIRLEIERNIPADKNSIGDLTNSRHMDHKNKDAANIKIETKIAENPAEDDEKSRINSLNKEIILPVPVPKSEVIELDENFKHIPEEESKDSIKIEESFGEMSLPHEKATNVDSIEEDNIRIVSDKSFEGTVSQENISPNETTIPKDDNLNNHFSKSISVEPVLIQEKVITNLNINYTPGPKVTPTFTQMALTTTPNNKRNNIQSENNDLKLSPNIQDIVESDNYWPKKSPNKHIEVVSSQKERGAIYRAFNRVGNEENIRRDANKTLTTDNNIEYAKEVSTSKDNIVLKNKNENTKTVRDLNKEKGEFIEDPPILKGKVIRLINRLHSVEPKPGAHSNEFVREIPKERSVLAKIAMFERQESNETIPKAEVMPQQDKIVKHTEPKIVEVVLKTPPERRRSNFNDTGLKFDILKAENKVLTQTITKPASTGNKINEKVLLPNDYRHETVVFEKKYDKPKSDHVKDRNLLTIQVETGKVLYDNETNKTMNNDETTIKIETNENRPVIKKNKVEATKSNNELSRRTYHDEFKPDEDSNLKRVKSLAELDLGDAVKGKVRNMIMRINSIDVLEEKKEVISIRERPRKKSVSTIIALFEGRLTPVQFEALKKANTQASYKSKVVTNQTPKMATTEVCAARLTELSTASTTYGKMDDVPRVKLSNGLEMPVLALGTALVEDVLGEEKIETVNVQHKNGDAPAELEPRILFHIITTAIELGYRAIDTAFIYGNQTEVGEAIRAKIDDGTVKREDLFISNKLWSTFHRPDLVEKACRDSLEAMGLSYFDLYMIHNPMSFKEDGDVVPMKDGVVQESEYDYMDAWSKMEELVPLGLARSIGVSNFNVSQLDRVLKNAKIPPVVNQIECHPYLAQDALHDYCAQHHVQLNCFGVLGSKGTPTNLKSHSTPVIDDPLVKVLASGLNMTPAQLLIRYQLERGHTATVKASTGCHLWDNLQAVKLCLSPTEVNALHGLNRNKRTFTYKGMGDTHKNYPFVDSS